VSARSCSSSASVRPRPSSCSFAARAAGVEVLLKILKCKLGSAEFGVSDYGPRVVVVLRHPQPLFEPADTVVNDRTHRLEIVAVEQEYFDRVWHERHLVFRRRYEAGEAERATPDIYPQALEAAERLEAERPDIRPVESDFEWGLWNGKLSALRWVLGEEWEFLDT
jgi:hypothetical protein